MTLSKSYAFRLIEVHNFFTPDLPIHQNEMTWGETATEKQRIKGHRPNKVAVFASRPITC
jgi:hypothetical protein